LDFPFAYSGEFEAEVDLINKALPKVRYGNKRLQKKTKKK